MAATAQLMWLFEVKYIDVDTLTTKTAYFASSPGYNDPTAPGFYAPVLIQPANIERHAFGTGQAFGTKQASYSFGAVQIINQPADLFSAGPYDSYLSQGFDGQTARMLIGDPTKAYNTFIVVSTGTVEQPFDDGKGKMTFQYHDTTLALQVAFQVNLFKGTNSGSTGVEGLATDIMNKPYPYGFGRVQNCTPPTANLAAYVYMLSYRQIQSVDTVYDGGATVTAGSSRATLALLQSNTPAGGTYDYYLGSATDGAYIKLGSTPNRTVTVDFHGDATGSGYVEKTADVANRILGMAISGAAFKAADVTALNSAQAAPIGLFVDSETTPQTLLDQIAAGAGCFYNTDSSGVWRIRQLVDPGTISAICTLKYFTIGVATIATDCDIISIERVQSSDSQSLDPNSGVPAWYINVNWGINYTVQAAGDLATSISVSRSPFTSLQFRSVVAQDSGTSSSNVAVGTGAKTFAINEAGAVFIPGDSYRINSVDLTKQMVGTCTTYSASSLVMNITATTGSGSNSSWLIDGTKAVHLLARKLSFDTLFIVQSDATAEALRLLTLYNGRRDFLRVVVQLQTAVGTSLIDLGSVVQLKIPRFGYAAGQNFQVIGQIFDAAKNQMTLELWGGPGQAAWDADGLSWDDGAVWPA